MVPQANWTQQRQRHLNIWLSLVTLKDSSLVFDDDEPQEDKGEAWEEWKGR